MNGLSTRDCRCAGLWSRIALLLLTAVAAALPAAGQSNCTGTVTTTADTGAGSLRQTIAAVSAASPNGTVCITATGTINLGSTLSIPQGLTITGPPVSSTGANTLTISGQGKYQDIFLALNEATQESGTVSISLVNITNSVGRGVIVQGGVSAYLGSVAVENNADGGIDNGGTLTLVASNVLKNTSKSNGGGIYNEVGGNLTVNDCSVSENNAESFYGGGLENEGVATITDTLFEVNTAAQGGAIENGSNAVDSGTILTISGGTQFLNNAVVGSGGGGAVRNEAFLGSEGETSNRVTIAGATFSGNTTKSGATGATTSGGAVYNGDQMTVRESTFDGNTADGVGGAIFNNGALGLIQDTVTGNTSSLAGSGISEGTSTTSTPASLSLNNTIVAGNTTDDCENCGTPGAGNLVGGTPMLGPLTYNDTTGLTTVMPLPGSPVIGGGVYATGADLKDERGLSRTTVRGNSVLIDIGAVQTHYNSVSFYQQPTNAQVGQAITPAVAVQVVEVDGSTTNYPLGVPVTMELIPTVGQQPEGSLSGNTVENPGYLASGAIAAVFADLSVTAAGSWDLVATTYPTSQDGQMATYSATSNAFTTSAPAGTVTLSWQPGTITYGSAVPLNATATVNGQTGTGTFVYTFTSGPNSGSPISASTVYPVGTYNVQVAYTPSGSTTTYTLGTLLTIHQATPVVTVATPGTVLPGAVVSLANVHGTATYGGAVLAGTFGYSPALGTAVSSGETVTVTFTPTDTTDYVSGVSSQATLSLLAQQTTTTTLTPSANQVLPGVPVGLTATVTPATGASGAVPGTEAFSVTSPSSAIGTVNLALAPGTAKFVASPVQTYNGSIAYNTYSADFDGDGVADLLAVADGGLPQLLLSVPGARPSLAAAIPLNLGSTCSYAIGLAVGDVNGDGLPDVAAACVNEQTSATTLVVMLNQGGGNFVPSPTVTTLSPGIGSVQMVMGKFGQSGAVGLVMLTACDGDNCSSTLDYLQGDGAGNFSQVRAELINNAGTSDSFANLLAGDFNGDGYQDVAFLHASNALPNGVVEVWTNAGGSQPTFGQVISSANQVYAATETITAGNGSATLLSLVSADLNQDGKPDLALTTAVTDAYGSDAYSSISVALNQSANGVLVFPTATTDTPGNGAVSSIVAADFDGDGVPDIGLYDSYNGTVRVLHGALVDGGYGFSFTEPNLLFTVSTPSEEPDIVRGRAAGRLGRRAAGLRPEDSLLNGLIYPVLAVGDTNGDGYPDLLVGQVVQDENYNFSYEAQQFLTSGPSVGLASITAPNGTTSYTAATTPKSGYWAPSTGAATLSVTSIATSTSLSVTPAAPVYGTAITLSSQVVNTATGTAAVGGSVTFTEDGTTTLGTVAIDANGKASYTTTSVQRPTAGTHTFGASYSGATGEGPSAATGQTEAIAKFTPTLNWAVPAAISTTTPLSGTQLDATAIGLPQSTLALPGTAVYTPAAGVTLPEGSQTLSVTFTPTDTTDYAAVSGTVQIQVNATTRTTLSLTPASASYTYGQAFTLTAAVVNVTGNGTSPVQGGSVTFGDSNGSVVLAPVTVVNGQASATGVVLPAGTQTISAVYTDTAGSGELGSSATPQSLVIAKATPVLTWATPAPITTATQLGSAQLDAVIKGVTGSVLGGTTTYSPAAGATLPQGSDTLSVSFVPTDAADYNNASGTVTIQVNSSGTVTTLGVSAANSTYGQALTLTAHVVNTAGTLPVGSGAVTFMAGSSVLSTVNLSNGVATLSGVVLGAGTQALSATYNGTSAEPSSTGTSTATIAQATPTLTWATPASISSTTPLSAAQLDATATGVTGASLGGTLVYTPSSGTLAVGTHTLSVTFTPTDAVDYATATDTVQIQVVNTNTQTTFTVAPGSLTYGQTVALSAQVVNTSGSAVVGSGSVVFASDGVTLGTISVVNGAASLSGVSLGGGQHLLTASYTGAPGEGTSAAAARTVTVAKAAPVLSWATPAAIASTTQLGGTQLDATAVGVTGASLAGVFTYTPGSGTLTVGTHTLSVSFAPTDAVDYATGTSQVSIQVVPETITLASISPATTPLGTTPLAVTVTGTGFPAGSVVQVNGTTLATTVISATQLGVTVPGADLAKAGALTFTIYDAASQAISNALTLTVTAPAATATVSVPATTTSAEQPTVGITLANSYPVDIAGTFTLTFAPAGANGVDDPAVQFSTGGRTQNFTIPAGTTTGPTATLQSGTVEGTISVGTQLTAGGVDVTPTDLQTPAAISVAASVPTITGVTFTNVNGLMTVVVTGFSNTREMTEANFVFTGPGAESLASAGVTVPATSLFGGWYTSEDSATFGSTFLYTQTFQLSDDTTNITGVAVTLTNTVGSSTSVSSQ